MYITAGDDDQHGQSGYNFDLGDFHLAINTSEEDVQRWFDRGLVWTHGFNHHEAAKCFERAIACEQTCPMAYWGLAYTIGPHYNKPWSSFGHDERTKTIKRAYVAAKSAMKHISNASSVERALIEALQYRYPTASATTDECTGWNQAYTDAMKSVFLQFNNHLEVAVLYVDSLMIQAPWKLWDLQTGAPTSIYRTTEIQRVLEKALHLDGAMKHPGLLHLYIHFMEMSPWPERALKASEHLLDLIPDAGHLRHMPSHLHLLIGDYRRAVLTNLSAVRADEKYARWETAPNFYTNYRVHDYHSLIYAAMFTGQSRIALEAAKALEETLPESLLRITTPPMADWMEGYISAGVHVLIRFGRWEDILQLELPKDPKLYCVTTTTIHYARALSFAATCRVPQAEAEQTLFRQCLQTVPATRTSFPNKCVDIFAVAEEMLQGEIEYRRGNLEVAFAHLRKSVALDDNLIYNEPWGWMQPTRHALAALLLDAGRVEEALTVYAEDLGLDKRVTRAQWHPDNVWALHGYHECLVRLGHEADAELVRPRLEERLELADVKIRCSCFCRRSRQCSGGDGV